MTRTGRLVGMALLILYAAPRTATLAIAGPYCSDSAELTGRPLVAYPWYRPVRTFQLDSCVGLTQTACAQHTHCVWQSDQCEELFFIGIDPSRHPSILGAECNLVVVDAKSAAEWEIDPYLVDARPTEYENPQTVEFPSTGGIQDSGFRVLIAHADELTADTAPCHEGDCSGFGHAYDVVLDCDGDGMVGAGDFIDGAGEEAGFYLVHDPGEPRLPVVCVDYSLSGMEPAIARERTYAPRDHSAIAGCQSNPPTCLNHLPLVVISHGNGHRYDKYNYLEQHLASYGYIVMSLQNHGQYGAPVTQFADDVLDHVKVFLETLAASDCATRVVVDQSVCSENPLDVCSLAQQIDPHRIVLIGHSRGGNAVVLAYDRLGLKNEDAFVSENFTQSDIALLVGIAPTDVELEIIDGPRLADPGTAPYAQLWTSGDADVSGAPHTDENKKERMAFQLFDRARGDRQSLYVHGGAHGWFHENCTSPVGADCTEVGPGGLNVDTIHVITTSYFVPLLKVYLEHNVAGQDFLWRQWGEFPSDVPGTEVAKEHEFGTDPDRIIIDNYELNFEDPGTSSSGLKVDTGGTISAFEGKMADEDCHFDWERSTHDTNDSFSCNGYALPTCPSGYGTVNWNSHTPCDFVPDCSFAGAQPMNAMTRSREGSASRAAVLEWARETNAPAPFYEWQFDPAASVGESNFLSLRMAQMPRHPETRAELGDLDVKVVVRDEADNVSGLCLGALGAAVIEPYQRDGPTVRRIYDIECKAGNQSCGIPPACNPSLSDRGWQAEFETVRIPLGDFLSDGSGLDLDAVAAVRLEFGSCGAGLTSGRMAVDDVELTSPRLSFPPPPPCPSVSPCNGLSCVKGEESADFDTTMSSCQPAEGQPIYCGSGTVHKVTYECARGACCDQQPPCICGSTCDDGTYLECR